jgi:hypothetical protein
MVITSNSKKWILPSGRNVGEIINENVSANTARVKDKKKVAMHEIRRNWYQNSSYTKITHE